MAEPAPRGIRFAWGVALTPVAGLFGLVIAFALYFHLVVAGMGPVIHAQPAPPQPPQPEDLGAVFGLAALGSLFAWPVTVAVLPLVRGRFWRQNWKAFWALACSGAVAGFPAPLLVILVMTALQGGLRTLLPLDRLDPLLMGIEGITGAISGLVVAIPYFFLTRPWRSSPWTEASEAEPPAQA